MFCVKLKIWPISVQKPLNFVRGRTRYQNLAGGEIFDVFLVVKKDEKKIFEKKNF